MFKKMLVIFLLLALLLPLFGCRTTDQAHNLHHDMVRWRDYEGIHGDIDYIVRANKPCPLRRDFAR